ncbi:hypothetical protein [Paracoccus luteus]|uniref:hypothetical protein n=1 Tax=Paracoccus luteus TaxID=2508543 RepID=UPI001FE8DE6F|nr:hypothetical protein [Paracoccus luteus]
MTLILLAISLTLTACVIAWNLAIYALPVMTAITAAQLAWGAGAGVLLSGLSAAGAALLSVALVILVLGFARNPVLRFIALALFAVPAVIAGYARSMASPRTPSTRTSPSTCSAASEALSSASRPSSI